MTICVASLWEEILVMVIVFLFPRYASSQVGVWQGAAVMSAIGMVCTALWHPCLATVRGLDWLGDDEVMLLLWWKIATGVRDSETARART